MGLQAVELFHRVPSQILDHLTYLCVLNACSHSGLIDTAWKIFEQIPMKDKREKIYTAMVHDCGFFIL